MSEKFKKIKLRYLYEAVLKSVAAGLSVGLLCAGATLLALKLAYVEINAFYYVLIGLIPGVMCGASFFFRLRPCDEDVAKKLDYVFGLKERAQTMVAFDGKSGDMLEIQRDDASAVIAALPPLRVTLGEIWQYIVCGLLSVAVFVTAVILPFGRNAAADDPDDEPALISEQQIQALATLKVNVENSLLAESVKAPSTAALDELYRTITDDAVLVKYQLRSAIYDTVLQIDGAMDRANTYRPIARELVKRESTVILAKNVMGAPTAYRMNGFSDPKDFDSITAVWNGIDEMIANLFEPQLDSIRATFAIEKSKTEEPTLKSALSSFTQAMTAGLAESAYEDDALYAALVKFNTSLKTDVEDVIADYNDSALQQRIADAFNTFKLEAVEAFSTQSYNLMMQYYMRYTLCETFSVSESDLPPLDDDSLNLPADEEDPSGSGNGNGDDDDDTQHGGSSGDKDVNYGSNDLIYNPQTGEKEPYGPLLYQYYNNVELIKAEMEKNGTLTPELEQFLDDYFSLLFGEEPKPNENQQ